MTDQKQLRHRIRSERREMDDAMRIMFSNDICAKIQSLGVYQKSAKVAVFRSFDGEVNIGRLVEHALDCGKQVFLPIIVAKGQPLKFAWYDRQSVMRENRFGIPEPQLADDCWLEPEQLDLVITPLVAFDEGCLRLGMGGGFYDRTFAFRHSSNGDSSKSKSPKMNSSPTAKPMLLGVAFDFQKVDHIDAQPWDVPLDAVVTEKNVYDRLA